MPFSRRTILAGTTLLPLFAIGGKRASAAEITMRWGDGRPPDHPGTIRAREAIKAIREESKGRIEINHFPASQLGGDSDMLSQLRSGALEFYTTTAPFVTSIVPVAGLSGIGFAFPDYNRVWEAMDGEVGATIRKSLAPAGIHMFEKAWDNGYRQISSSTRPIHTPADLKGFKIRVAVVPLFFSMFKSLRASPVSLSFGEVYSALQTGLIDGQENPLVQVYTGNFHEVQKTISMTNHVWDGLIVTANLPIWNALSGADRDLISRHINAAALKQRDDVRDINEKLKTTLTGKGLKFNDVDPKPFKELLRTSGYYAEWKRKFGGDAWAALSKYADNLG